MTNQLIAHVNPAHLEQVHWIVFDEQNQRIAGPFFTPLADLANYTDIEDCQLSILLASQSLLLTTLHLPTSTGSQIHQSIAFALEEELVEDIEDSHFAYNATIDSEGNPQQAVAIIQRELLQNLIEQLTLLKLHPQAIIPDIYALPITENHWTVLLTEQNAFVRLDTYTGFTIERELLASFLESHIATIAHKPTINVINLSAPLTEEEHTYFNALAAQYKTEHKNFIDYLANHYLTSPFTLNLLQGDFNLTFQKPAFRRLAKTAMIMLATCATLFMSEQLLAYYYYSKTQQQLSQQISTLYQQFFPNATQVVSPKQRIEKLLKEARQQEVGNQGLQWFAQLAPLLYTAQSTDKSIKLTQAKIEATKLSLEITASQLEPITKLYEQFKKSGLNVIQKNTQQQDQSISTYFEVNP